jgi:multidrug efflux pump subunit AcrB
VLERLVDWFYRPIERVYMHVLAYVIDRRWIVVLAAFAAVGSCVPLVKKVPKGFLPKNDEAQFEISVRTPEGTSLAATQIAAERIAREVRTWPEVTTTLLSIGDNPQKTPNLASIFVRLLPPDGRKLTQDQLQDKARHEIVPKQPKDYRISVSQVAAFGAGTFSTATVQYILTGPDLDRIIATRPTS